MLLFLYKHKKKIALKAHNFQYITQLFSGKLDSSSPLNLSVGTI